MTLDYFKKLIDPLRELDETGFLCQIGQGIDAVIVHCFPYIAMVVADNLAANQMCSIIGQGKGIGKRCRICDCSKLYQITNTFIYRDPNLTENIFREFDVLMTKKDEIVQTANEFKVLPGLNFFIDVGKHNLKHKLTRGFHDLFPPDILHTLLLGMVLNCISWSVNIFLIIDQIQNSYMLSAIDTYIKEFPLLSISPYLSCNFSEGITNNFQSNKNTADKGTGMASGSIPAWKLPNLLFKLMFSIAININIDIKQKYLQKLDVFKIISLACKSVLYLTWLMDKKKSYSKVDLEDLSNLIKNCRESMFKLYELKGVLTNYQNCKGNLSILKTLPTPHFNDLKSHLLEHMPEYIQLFGKHETNTEKTERHHIEIKKKYRGTNKKGNVSVEIVRHIKRDLFISGFKIAEKCSNNIYKKIDEIFSFKKTHSSSSIIITYPMVLQKYTNLRLYICNLLPDLNSFVKYFNPYIANLLEYNHDKYTILLHNAITCSGNSDVEKFIIHANNEYKMYKTDNPYFSTLEVSFIDIDNFIHVKVLAILGIQNNNVNKEIKFHLLIVKLRLSNGKLRDPHLPYDVYEYEYEGKAIHPKFVEVETVNFPSCMLPLESDQTDKAKNMDTLKFYHVKVFTKDYFKIKTEEVRNQEVINENLYLDEEENCDYDDFENYDNDDI